MPHRLLVSVALFCACAVTLAAQTVYPTGTTIYDPSRAWSGYTVLSPLLSCRSARHFGRWCSQAV
jgi:hypothetical protein